MRRNERSQLTLRRDSLNPSRWKLAQTAFDDLGDIYYHFQGCRTNDKELLGTCCLQSKILVVELYGV